MKNWRNRAIVFFLGLSLSLFSSLLPGAPFAAEKDFPKKEITIICSFAAGGSRDILARGVGKFMSKHLGVSMVVSNLPGAGGMRGIITLYHSEPDGYTIGIGAATEIIEEILEKQDFDSKKFNYIGRAQSSPHFFYVKTESPFRSFKDFKTHGKPVRFASFSPTSVDTVPAIIMAKRDGFPLAVIGGYQGGASALLGLLRGEVEFTGVPLSPSLSYVKSGQIRAIATFGSKRSPEFPDVPTIGELGHKDLEILTLDYWFMAPPQVPKARLQILEDTLMKTINDPEFQTWAKGAGVDPSPLGSEETTKVVFSLFGTLEPFKADLEKYRKK